MPPRALLPVILGLAVAAVPGQGLAAATATATGARIGGDQNRTRFVADLDRSVNYTVYVLPDPYRVIIDMPDVTFNLPPGIGEQARGLISQYRYGQVAAGKSRIVMDTTGPVLIDKTFVLDPQSGQPARIVVDLVPTSPENFAATYHKEEMASATAVASAAGTAVVTESRAEAAPAPAATHAGKARPLIVIDPGHGGIDPGAIGISQTKEKDVVLAFGLELRDQLLKSGQYDVAMTRSDDTFVTLKERVRFAREREADLFIAIHADTIHGHTTHGATIYTLSDKASDKEAEALAQKENRADIIGGIDLAVESEEVTGILIDLAQRESKSHSVFFAKRAVAEMRPVTGFTGKPLRSAGFVVLKAPDVPSVLVELGYLSSRRDESQLNSDKWRAKVAAALTRAIDKYFATEVAFRSN
jgi:N-acetylmuramoyl-L-alanine amidase